VVPRTAIVIRYFPCCIPDFSRFIRFTWTDMISGGMKWGAACGRGLCFSAHHENFGIVVAEPLAAGTPALISHKVNVRREVETDGGGIEAEGTFAATCESFRCYSAYPKKKAGHAPTCPPMLRAKILKQESRWVCLEFWLALPE
jgi:hypothetical protein